jgi:hypothetical protein
VVSPEQYIQLLMRNLFASDLEILTVCEILNTQICIFSESNNGNIIVQNHGDLNASKVIELCFLGNHYRLAVKVDKKPEKKCCNEYVVHYRGVHLYSNSFATEEDRELFIKTKQVLKPLYSMALQKELLMTEKKFTAPAQDENAELVVELLMTGAVDVDELVVEVAGLNIQEDSKWEKRVKKLQSDLKSLDRVELIGNYALPAQKFRLKTPLKAVLQTYIHSMNKMVSNMKSEPTSKAVMVEHYSLFNELQDNPFVSV